MSGEYVFTWKIKNYSSCYQAKAKQIVSPFFTIENMPHSQWRLSFYPNGDSSLEYDEKYVSLYLNWKAVDVTIKTATVSYSLEIVDERDCVLKSFQARNRKLNREVSSWGWPKFLAIHELEKEMSNWNKDELTLRCRMEIGNQLKQKLSGAVACTTIEVDRFFVDWNVKIPTLFEYSESITFPISDVYNVEVSLNSATEALAILIHFKEEDPESQRRLTFTISIFNKIGCMLASKRAVHVYENAEAWNFPDFITKEMLKHFEVSLSHYEFKLKCEVCISKENVSSYIEKFTFRSPCVFSIPKYNATSNMQSEFQKLFISKKYSDVTIRSENDEFPVHKFVLKVRSPVFAAMFDQDMLENKTGVVDMADIDTKTLRAFLEFLYTDTVDKMDYDIAKTLILTADKYQVAPLVDECASFMKSIVSIENVCEIIVIADMTGCEQLKSYALSYIEVHASNILHTAAWANLIEVNIKLATYILSNLSANFAKSAMKLI